MLTQMCRNTLKKENLQVFHEMFIMLNENHTYCTRAAAYHFLDILQVKTTHFGQYSVKIQASETWNNLQRTQNRDLLTSKPSEFKKALFQTYLAKYSNNTQSNLLFIICCNFLSIFMSLMSPLLMTHILIINMIIVLLNTLTSLCQHFFTVISITVVAVNAIIT